MNPWYPIGWIVLFVMVIGIGSALVAAILIAGRDVVRLARRLTLHFRTYRTPPEEGQRWMQPNGYSIEVRGVSPTHIAVSSGNASWSIKNEEWHRLTRRLSMYLIRSSR